MEYTAQCGDLVFGKSFFGNRINGCRRRIKHKKFPLLPNLDKIGIIDLYLPNILAVAVALDFHIILVKIIMVERIKPFRIFYILSDGKIKDKTQTEKKRAQEQDRDVKDRIKPYALFIQNTQNDKSDQNGNACEQGDQASDPCPFSNISLGTRINAI